MAFYKQVLNKKGLIKLDSMTLEDTLGQKSYDKLSFSFQLFVFCQWNIIIIYVATLTTPDNIDKNTNIN